MTLFVLFRVTENILSDKLTAIHEIDYDSHFGFFFLRIAENRYFQSPFYPGPNQLLSI